MSLYAGPTKWRRPWTAIGWIGIVGWVGACGSDPIAPERALPETMASAHFVYHWSTGDQPPDTAYQERHLAWVTSKLGLSPRASIDYFKYRDQAHLIDVTGHRLGTGFAEPERYRFHTIWPKDNHEWVHVLVMDVVGTPPGLFNEGVAVAHHGASLVGAFDGAPLWNGTSVHAISRTLRASSRLPTLDDLLENGDFSAYDGQVSYPVAGSFVRYLLDQEGPETFLAFLAACPRNATRTQIRARFRERYGDELDVWWQRWLAWL